MREFVKARIGGGCGVHFRDKVRGPDERYVLDASDVRDTFSTLDRLKIDTGFELCF